MKTDFERTLGLGGNNLLIKIANRYRIEKKRTFFIIIDMFMNLQTATEKDSKWLEFHLFVLKNESNVQFLYQYFPNSRELWNRPLAFAAWSYITL